MGHEAILKRPLDGEGLEAAARAKAGLQPARIDIRKGDGFTHAYATNLSHRLPLMYCVALFDMFILMVSFYGTAPAILTLWLPLLLMVGIIRCANYWSPINVRTRSLAELTRDIRRLPAFGTAAALIPMCWSLSLYNYGSETQQSLVHYIVAVSCFTAILSLGQSPRTAIRMAAVVMVPTGIFFLMHDHPNRFAVVAVQFVVTFLSVLITASYHADFVSHELSRQELSRRKGDFEKLAETNRLIASRDALTGVNNRRKILDLFEQALARSASSGPWLALLDLDGFKHINDTYGHAAGDAVLCAVCERIGTVPEIDAFGRMGGDEFALLISGSQEYSEVRAVLDWLCNALCRPIIVQDLKLSVKASIGLHRCRGNNVSESLERADAALYKAKEDRGGGVAKFTSADERALHERRALTRVFTSADLGRQIALVYQPIVDSDTGQPVTYEALARWSPDGKSLLPPSAFINLAETTGRIGELTEHVIAKALEECRAWQWGCSVSINLSAQDILHEDMAHKIDRLVAAAGAPPSGIIFEVTETALISDYHRAADNLEKLRSMGFRIALDDFGTGQSSLSHVHNLPLDHIKIDQSFARDIVDSERARAIVGTILALSRQLRLDCTIEGIETPEQQVIARALGVRMMQGYHFGRPSKAKDAFADVSADLLVSNA